jgi:poly(hydroxyalkanoate) depolymerase family esterase
MNAKTLTARGVALLLASAPLSASGGEFGHTTFSAKAYSGSRERRYQVFVPSAYNGRDAVPMVMVLHGCKQTEQNMINETRFKELAERENFIVVYPFITSYDETRGPNCWGFWFHQHIHEGAGEVEDLYGIGREVEATFKIDPERRYVTGLSSGAGMSVALAVARSEYFAAAGAAAGLPYSERSSSIGLVCANPGIFQSISAAVEAMRKEQKSAADRRVIPIMTIHSRNDCTVNPKASEIIRDSWLRRYGVSEAVTATSDCSQEGVACTQTKYGPAGPVGGGDRRLQRGSRRLPRQRLPLLGWRQRRRVRQSQRAERRAVVLGILQAPFLQRQPTAQRHRCTAPGRHSAAPSATGGDRPSRSTPMSPCS